MSWFRRAAPPPPPTPLTDRLDSALARMFDAQARQFEQMTVFFGTVSDLTAKRAAAALGSRGGRATARVKRARSQQGACALCTDSQWPHVTLEMISAHRLHQGANGVQKEAPRAVSVDSGPV